MDKRNKSVVLALGGNIGDVKETFESAILAIQEQIGDIIKISSVYITKAWGVTNQPDFLNQAIVVNTDKDSMQVLEICMNIEKILGRDRLIKKKWQERVIDIDVLFYEEEVIETTDLIVPHPLIHERNFVLFPLEEIIPSFIHPIFHKTIKELKNECKDNSQVIKTLD